MAVYSLISKEELKTFLNQYNIGSLIRFKGILEGIEKGINDQAKDRAIVIHGADYVSNQLIKQQGYIGRSLGCPAVPNNQVAQIINTIKGASCLFVYAPTNQYLNQSLLVKN